MKPDLFATLEHWSCPPLVWSVPSSRLQMLLPGLALDNSRPKYLIVPGDSTVIGRSTRYLFFGGIWGEQKFMARTTKLPIIPEVQCVCVLDFFAIRVSMNKKGAVSSTVMKASIFFL